MFSWFNASQAKEFANALADFLIEKLPKQDSEKNSKVMKKRGEVIASALWQVDQFKATHQLNVYQKAQLGNTLKWRLIEAQFEREFADEITHLVLTSL